ncbi:nucleotidyl transferase AbiEii/AbiGii toxin family protein [Candidatus Berkelbacteria bacterium]|nr:nucleotidyl transferase AbiEii/AbiGii toxin family protein [Candidatus Berkelbacteria bacterium]
MAKTILSVTQQQALDWLADNSVLTKQFYLSGGTALAEFYLKHRYSEDLDFFSSKEFDFIDLQPHIQSLRKFLKAKNITIENRFNRNLIFFETPAETLKLEFSWFVGEPIEKGMKYHKLTVDSKLDIAVNKLFTIYERPRARDYVDLYYLLPEFPLKKLIQLARIKFDWHIDLLQLGARFHTPDLSDWPRMVAPLKPETVRGCLQKLALKLGKEVIE